ncbi:MAG: flagellar biosynthesis protein FlgN [Treponema sp.]|nr:flagellar biosynthesis protein FlgN [Treponema sp.]
METTVINEVELAQRIAVLNRFKNLLNQQRDRFRNYIAVLEKQQYIISDCTAEELLAHVELEEQIVTDIFAIQKVIDPLEEMYNKVMPFPSDDDVPRLKQALEELKTQAVTQSSYNKNLLSERLTEIRHEITALKNNPLLVNSRNFVYRNSSSAVLVDMEG